MVDTEIRLIIFFAAKDGEALYSQQKQDWELTVAQVSSKCIQRTLCFFFIFILHVSNHMHLCDF